MKGLPIFQISLLSGQGLLCYSVAIFVMLWYCIFPLNLLLYSWAQIRQTEDEGSCARTGHINHTCIVKIIISFKILFSTLGQGSDTLSILTINENATLNKMWICYLHNVNLLTSNGFEKWTSCVCNWIIDCTMYNNEKHINYWNQNS